MRPTLNYANVASTMALALAVGGGSAYAASQITSSGIKDGTIRTKDLAKSTRKALAGKVGAEGKTGPPGAAGPVGARGDTGVKGEAGTPGTAGAAGAPALLARTTLVNSSALTQKPTSTLKPFLTAGDFSKTTTGSVVDITWSTTLGLTPANAGASYCTWQVRVDGAAPDVEGQAVNQASQGTTASTFSPTEVTSTFSALPAGTHTVSLWLGGANAPDCNPNVGGNSAVFSIKETSK